jgi:hypothetical protein
MQSVAAQGFDSLVDTNDKCSKRWKCATDVPSQCSKFRSVVDAARRAKSGIGQIRRESRGFRPYYVLDWSEGVGFAVMMFEDRESANGSARVHFNLCA